MSPPGRMRERLARLLHSAFAEGLLSETTLSHRLDLLFGPPVVDASGLVGDLSLRTRTAPLRAAGDALLRQLTSVAREPALLLALDWAGADRELVVGRHPSCDVCLAGATVSRRHARLLFRDGAWVVVDLGSLNGTTVNGKAVGRSRLHPGDRVAFAQTLVDVD